MFEKSTYDSNKTELHHIHPVSLGGVHKPYNLVELKAGVHNNLHKILDINPTILSRLQRKYREATNHKIVLGPDDIQMRGDMQDMFFDRIHHLPKYVQHEHINKGMEELDFHKGVYKKLTGEELDKPKRFTDTKEQFFELHHASIEAQKEIAKVILEAVKKNFNL